MNATFVSLLLCAATPLVAQSGATTLTQHLQAARQAQAHQDCATAAKEYSAAVRILPSSGELRTNLGIALYCDNRFTEAQTALRKALSLNPDLAAPHLFLGLTAFHLSDSEAAVRELSDATQRMPTDLTGHLWLGYAWLSKGENEKAAQAFQATLQLQPSNVDASYALGEAYLDICRQRSQQLVDSYPRGRGLRLLLAHQQALKTGDAVTEQPGTPAAWASPREESLYQEALDAEQKAQVALQQVLDEAPGSDRAHEIQGNIESTQRNNEAAIREYREVVRINSTLPGVRVALANCLMQTAQFDAALAVLNQEKELTPRSATVLASIGQVQLALGKDAEALQSLRAATALPGVPPAAELLLGKSLLRTGDAKGSVPHLEQALRQGADPAAVNYLLARAYRATGDRAAMAKALDAYRQTSKDEVERQAASALIQRPGSLPTGMSPQETQEASTMVAQTN